MINYQQLQAIIEYLQGTCLTLQDAVETITESEYNEDDLTTEQHDFIANEIFLCDDCGWWCEVSEAAEHEDSDQICEDCAETRDPNYFQKNS